jgi:hypothetical protein
MGRGGAGGSPPGQGTLEFYCETHDLAVQADPSRTHLHASGTGMPACFLLRVAHRVLKDPALLPVGDYGPVVDTETGARCHIIRRR